MNISRRRLRFPVSLTTQILLLLITMVVVTGGAVAGLIFTRLDDQLIDAELTALDWERELQGNYLLNELGGMERDVLFLAGTPPIQGIIRATQGGGVDPLDGSTRQMWNDRLENLFEEMLKSHPDYTQIRYIGVADGGRELVRVDAAGGPVIRVPGEALQQKGERSYFTETAALPPGMLFLSPIELNREHGEIVQPHQPVMRVATPVYTLQGALFGIVIINTDADAILASLTHLIDSNRTYYLVNSEGYYLHHPEPERTFGFELGQPPAALTDFPGIQPILAAPGQKVRHRRENSSQLISARTLLLSPEDQSQPVTFVMVGTIEGATAVSGQVLRQVSVVLALLLIAALLLGTLLSRRISEPILRLAGIVERATFDAQDVEIPDDLSGEAGVLSDALSRSWLELQRRTVALEASNKELEQFAYIASHDLQEPVRTVSNFMQLLEEDYGGQLDAAGRSYITRCLRASERMMELIRGLLEYSRLGQERSMQEVDCWQLIADICTDMDARIQESGAQVRFEGLPRLQGYQAGLRLLFANLISNAIKFHRPGQAPVVDISARREGRGWRFTVADNGLGIQPEHRERVFLIFQRLHSRAAIEGTGIGLAHCRKVVELHGGRIWIEEGEGGGTAIRFQLKDAPAS